jgi:hypothetical protein
MKTTATLEQIIARVVDAEPIVSTVCSWCPDAKARTVAAMLANGGRPVSHGICASCIARFEEGDK